MIFTSTRFLLPDKGGHKLIVHNEIGGADINIMFGLVDDV
ncbi:hypothetical protein EVA_14838 [gut metagenome]|uniref:Uncharacterized protein n=1 Tax=gut metagenome TaxID=749906 RepID=J9CB05_9ZZZZ